MVAEDQLIPVIGLANLLNEKSLKYDIARDGQIEVELLKNNLEKTCCATRYRLIITDINMPVMDGFEAAI